MDTSRAETTTLTFELAALRRAADPARTFRSARAWATNVGIVSDEPTYVVTNFARQEGIELAFNSGRHDLYESLRYIRSQPEHDAERYVLVGTDAVDEEQVEERGWELVPIEEAAEKAGWKLEEPDEGDEDEGMGESRDGWP